MTALFDYAADQVTDTDRAQRVLDDARADHHLGLVLSHARSVGGRDGIRLLQRYGGQLSAAQSELAEEFVDGDGGTRRAERAFDDGRTSKREQRKKANRAKAVGHNPDLATKLADGELGEEQLDVIADASAKTDGAAAVDQELIDKVSSVPPEQGKQHADDYLAARATKDGIQTEHNRQRALRRAYKYNSKRDNLDTIAVSGDGPAIEAAWKAIEKRADEIYQRDGGKELPDRKHPRTRDQRLFDATCELINDTTINPAGATTTTATDDTETRTSGRTTKKKQSASKRPQVVIGLTLPKLTGQDPAAIATQFGYGLIPDSVLANYAADADFIVALFSHTGEPLWLHRLERYATHTQMIALILRDGGCVLCRADHTRCEAHHTMPWNAPGKGETNLDNLVLLCGPCHRKLHTDHHTIYQDNHATWRTRPATPNEVPPQRPSDIRNNPRRE